VTFIKNPAPDLAWIQPRLLDVAVLLEGYGPPVAKALSKVLPLCTSGVQQHTREDRDGTRVSPALAGGGLSVDGQGDAVPFTKSGING
jgi:hypothetical protein